MIMLCKFVSREAFKEMYPDIGDEIVIESEYVKIATCDYCENMMFEGMSCQPTLLHKGLIYKRIPCKEKKGRICHDCNVASGQYHHLGCDMERCPICERQLITCGCFYEELEDADNQG